MTVAISGSNTVSATGATQAVPPVVQSMAMMSRVMLRESIQDHHALIEFFAEATSAMKASAQKIAQLKKEMEQEKAKSDQLCTLLESGTDIKKKKIAANDALIKEKDHLIASLEITYNNLIAQNAALQAQLKLK